MSKPTVGVLSLELYLPGTRSLKEKRMAVKGLKDALKRNHNVSVSEVGHLDLWQRSLVMVAAVAGDRAGCEKMLAGALREVEKRFRGEVLDAATEFL